MRTADPNPSSTVLRAVTSGRLPEVAPDGDNSAWLGSFDGWFGWLVRSRCLVLGWFWLVGLLGLSYTLWVDEVDA